MTDTLIARCTCGQVEFEATGPPIASAACYCDDCQAGGGQIEALPHADRVLNPDGGTEYLVYRKDRVRCTKGGSHLKPYKIMASSATNRVVATCCNAAMVLNFDDSKHWIDLFRNRVQGEVPPIQMRICTRYKKVTVGKAAAVPEYPKYPLKFLWKLLGSKIQMLIGR